MMNTRSRSSNKKYTGKIGEVKGEADEKPEKKREEKKPYWERLPVQTRIVVDKSALKSNGCYPLDNTPTDYQEKELEYKILGDGEIPQYSSFMPTGQVYEFLPCAPMQSHAKTVIGFKKYRGMHKIMDIEGAPEEGKEAFVPYKLLLYRGVLKKEPERDDGYRFVYLAEQKPGEPAVGDCFIPLQEIHKRMKSILWNYFIFDCETAITRSKVLQVASSGNAEERKAASKQRTKLQKEGQWLLRFRCWAVGGFPCATHELNLCNRLFKNVFDANDRWDHLEVFKVWAELLRKSQGDKLASKDFFGRYWDAVIPPGDKTLFATGFFIVIDERYLSYRGIDGLDRGKMKNEVFAAVKRVLDAPRLKFRPNLTIDNVVFFDRVFTPWAQGWDKDGWRSLEPHPGGLYTIYVSRPVREFLCRDTHGKPLWQERYPAPPKTLAEGLNKLLTNCTTTERTETWVEHKNVVAARKGKRSPTQDKCVAKEGHSANAALSITYPGYYPSVAKAKKRRVAEWLHRSAFSYGGIREGDLSSSQVPNNLVLGTPDTNTVMMRYEAFVKRLAYYSNNEGHALVLVMTEIHYPCLVGWDEDWIGKAKYTWLAPRLFYCYSNDKTDKPHVLLARNLHPLNRETCMLFEALLDKSIEKACWEWDCWDSNAVAKALIESTALDGGEEGPFEVEDLKDLVKEGVLDDKGNPLPENDLEALVQQDLDQRP